MRSSTYDAGDRSARGAAVSQDSKNAIRSLSELRLNVLVPRPEKRGKRRKNNFKNCLDRYDLREKKTGSIS